MLGYGDVLGAANPQKQQQKQKQSELRCQLWNVASICLPRLPGAGVATISGERDEHLLLFWMLFTIIMGRVMPRCVVVVAVAAAIECKCRVDLLIKHWRAARGNCVARAKLMKYSDS